MTILIQSRFAILQNLLIMKLKSNNFIKRLHNFFRRTNNTFNLTSFIYLSAQMILPPYLVGHPYLDALL